MNRNQFDTLLRSPSETPSRRSALRLLAGSALGSLLTRGVGEALAEKSGNGKGNGKSKKGKKVTICHKGQTVTVAKSAVKGHKKHGDTIGACPSGPTPSGPVLTYQCSAPHVPNAGSGSIRFAQVFTAERSGPLRQIQFNVTKEAGTTGDYVVQLLRVIGSKPSHSAIDVLVSVTVPDAEVATSSDATVTATFAGPALVAGTEYAVSFSRPGSGLGGAVSHITLGGGTCGGKLFVADGAGPFNEAINQDLLVSVLVG